MHDKGSQVEPRTDQTQFRRALDKLNTATERTRLRSEGKRADNKQLYEAAKKCATELASVAGPTHLLALAAEGLKRCTGVCEQITVPSMRFWQQMQRDPGTFHLLHQQLRDKKLLDTGVTLEKLAEKFDGVIDARNKHIHLAGPPTLHERMKDALNLLRKNKALADQHKDCAMVIEGWIVLRNLYPKAK